MQIVLLSGGAGKRLWPLSNDLYSKQFLRLLKREDGSRESMIQRVCRQVRSAAPDVPITIATGREQTSLIRRQLGSAVNISVEPCRRDTFPAIALVSAYLHEVRGVPLDEAVAICPADPYVDAEYFRAVVRLLREAERKGAADLILMGVEPTYPSEKYGYIMPASPEPQSLVQSFKEKPDKEMAAAYIEKGALWNSGVFAFKLGYALGKARELLGYTDYEDLFHRYEGLSKISFDYAVVEKERNIVVQRYSGTWLDIGTWNTLAAVMPEHTIGRVTMDETCRNVHVVNTMPMHGLEGCRGCGKPGGHTDRGQGALQCDEALCGAAAYARDVCREIMGRVPHRRCGDGESHDQDYAQSGKCAHLSPARTAR